MRQDVKEKAQQYRAHIEQHERWSEGLTLLAACLFVAGGLLV